MWFQNATLNKNAGCNEGVVTTRTIFINFVII